MFFTVLLHLTICSVTGNRWLAARAGRSATRASGSGLSGPVHWLQGYPLLLQDVSHSVLQREPSHLFPYLPNLFQSYIVWPRSVQILSFLGRRHCVLSVGDTVCVLLVGLIEPYVAHGPVFLLDVGTSSAYDCYRTDFGFCRAIDSVSLSEKRMSLLQLLSI